MINDIVKLRGLKLKHYERRSAEWLSVIVSGYCLSEGRFFYGLRGVIGTWDGVQFKLWPDEPTGDGKLWFSVHHARVQIAEKP